VKPALAATSIDRVATKSGNLGKNKEFREKQGILFSIRENQGRKKNIGTIKEKSGKF